ncbi:hypothetical protein TNCV_3507031 [Trichonephila clavipes]|uniref:Uncharacterized protein n=1 Tax=Trichonephila clavipes TaxID=2585209 RepID=A0A8X6S995_TRICX|nr:hypothetical protein TNCV_3507031 [Trichonephila clavipes]
MRLWPTFTASDCTPASARDPLSRGVRKRGGWIEGRVFGVEPKAASVKGKATEVRVEATSKRHLDVEAGAKRFSK